MSIIVISEFTPDERLRLIKILKTEFPDLVVNLLSPDQEGKKENERI